MIKKVKEKFTWLIRLGTHPKDPTSISQEIINVNFFNFVMTIVGSSYSFIFQALNLPQLAFMAPFATLMYLPPFYFNYRGWIILARYWCLWAFTVNMSIFAVVGGAETNIQLGFFISACICFLVFGGVRKASLQAAAQAVFFVVVAVMQHYWPAPELQNASLKAFSGPLIGVTVLGIVIVVLGQFLFRIRKLEHELLDQIHKRERLISLLSHDIRNPLTVVLRTISKLRNGTLVMGTDVATDKLKKSSEFLNFIVLILNNVQTLLALESGKLTKSIASHKIDDLIDRAVELFRDRLNEKGQTIDVHKSYEGDGYIKVDAELVVLSVFGNLISNAIKFSPRGATIKIGLKSLAGGSYQASFEDQGVGIPQEIINHIFMSHVPTTRLGTEKEKGTGFGLPLAAEVMKIHGGTIEVVSPVRSGGADPGTRFEVSFPLD